VASERVTTTYDLERTTNDGRAYHAFELELAGTFHYGTAYRDDPGECSLEVERVTCGPEPFELTIEEERRIVDGWIEDLRS